MANKYQASIYAATRPTYPASLFSLISSLTKKHERAWDVGTGTGQAAVALAELYDQVIATDVSDQLLKFAEKRDNITYVCTNGRLSREELTKYVGEEGSVDLVTVATAVHWFDLPSFYSNVKHILRKPGGVIAVWCYLLPTICPTVDAVLADVFHSTLPYMGHPGIDLVMDRYETLEFPFEPVTENGTGPVRIDATEEVTLEWLLKYPESWSSMRTARERGVELCGEEVKEAFRKAWGDPDQIRTATYSFYLRIGTVAGPP